MRNYCFYGNIYNSLCGSPKGGAELQLGLIVRYLSTISGAKINVIDLNISENQYLENINIISLKKENKDRKHFHWLFTFYKLLNEQDADIFYGRIRSSIHLIPLYIANKKKSLFVFHISSDLDTLNFKERYIGYYSKSNSFLRIIIHFFHSEILFSKVLNYSDLIIVQHDSQKDNLLMHKRFFHKEILKINNLFEYTTIKNRTDSINSSFEDKYYLSIGSIDNRKGCNLLLEIISRCKSQKFIIIGRVRDLDGKAFLKNISQLPNVKHFDQLPHDEVLDKISNSCGIINTSYFEGFSNVFLEAWAYGVPVFSLFVDPSGIITKNNIGKCYLGNIENMINELNETNYYFEEEKIKEYVLKNHDPKYLINILNNKIEELYVKKNNFLY